MYPGEQFLTSLTVGLEAVFLGTYVAAGPLEMWRAGTDVRFAKLGGATSPYLSLVHDLPLARLRSWL